MNWPWILGGAAGAVVVGQAFLAHNLRRERDEAADGLRRAQDVLRDVAHESAAWDLGEEERLLADFAEELSAFAANVGLFSWCVPVPLLALLVRMGQPDLSTYLYLWGKARDGVERERRFAARWSALRYSLDAASMQRWLDGMEARLAKTAGDPRAAQTARETFAKYLPVARRELAAGEPRLRQTRTAALRCDEALVLVEAAAKPEARTVSPRSGAIVSAPTAAPSPRPWSDAPSFGSSFGASSYGPDPASTSASDTSFAVASESSSSSDSGSYDGGSSGDSGGGGASYDGGGGDSGGGGSSSDW